MIKTNLTRHSQLFILQGMFLTCTMTGKTQDMTNEFLNKIFLPINSN